MASWTQSITAIGTLNGSWSSQPDFPMKLKNDELANRINFLKAQLDELLASPPIPFDSQCWAAFPVAPGIYRIFDPDDSAATIRAGRSKAKGGLRQRLYQNHLMGKQKGNLCSQLVRDRVCDDFAAAKKHIRSKLVAQVLVVEDDRDRAWLEHFMLAVLRPRYSD
jgi:hypothetical protein